MSDPAKSLSGSCDQQKTSIHTISSEDITASSSVSVSCGGQTSSGSHSDSSSDTSTASQISSGLIEDCKIPEGLRAHLAQRLETGLDGIPKLDDPFLDSVKRDRTAFIVARKYTEDASLIQPVSQDLLSQNTPEEQLVILRRLVSDKETTSSLWISIAGVEEKVMEGISDLCGLPTNTMSKSLKGSEHRHHRSHIETHPGYTYIQLLIQQTPMIHNETPIYDMVRNSFKPQTDTTSIDNKLQKGRAPSRGSEDGEDEVVRVGFMSMFIIPQVNVLLTITLPYYDCPASRLVIHTAKMDAASSGQLEIATDATLLGLSMVHRVVGYASGVTRQAGQTTSRWARLVNQDLTIERINEISEMIITLQDFKKRLKPLQSVYRKLGNLPLKYQIQHPAKSAISAEMTLQGTQRLDEVFEQVDGLVERCKILEGFAFSMMSMRANESMERLAIVTIVFLPLTFIASYFSMGFDDFSDLSRPPIYFWEISIPLSMVFFIIFAYSNLKRGYFASRKVYDKLKRQGEKEVYWAKKDVELWWRANRRKWGFGDGGPPVRRRGGGV
ncbi:hypothetical protein IAT40_001084 [Kwoniella sp. CBS 6097]